MNYKLSDFTLAGWVLLLTALPAMFGGGMIWSQVLLWLFAEREMEISHLVLAMPGLAYVGLYWGFCQWRRIRLVKPNRGYDEIPVPWRTLGMILLAILVPMLLVFAILVINRLLNPM